MVTATPAPTCLQKSPDYQDRLCTFVNDDYNTNNRITHFSTAFIRDRNILAEQIHTFIQRIQRTNIAGLEENRNNRPTPLELTIIEVIEMT